MGIQTNFFVDTANNHTKFMKKTIWVPRVVLVLFMLVSSIPFANAQFTAGRLVVVQTSGDSSDLNSPITLVEYTTGGTSGNTLALPSTSGNNPIQILCGSTGSEGLLTTSADGQLLILAGFSSSATTQTVNLANSTAASTSRVVYTVNALNITTQVASSNADFTGNDIRVAVSDGTNFWTGGAASTVAPYDGIDYFPSTSPTSSTNLYPTSTTMPKVYGMRIFNGNLYFSSQKSPYTNQICQLGTGLPTSGNPTVTTLFTVSSPTSPVSQSKATPVDFSIDPTNTYAYVSINYNGKTSVSGIQKWQNISGTWTYQYTLPTSGTALNGYFGLVVDWTTGPNYTMYATRSDAISTTGGANNKIIKVIDMGSAASSTVSTVYTPPNGSYIHGIAFTPFVTGYSLAGATYCQGTTSTPLSVTVASNVSSAVSYQWYSNTTASISGGTLISGATNSTYTPSTTTAGTTYYYCIVQGTACPASSKVSGAIIVNAVPVIGSQSTATATYCTTGTATALSVTATGTGLSYQWYSNTSASNTGGTIISGATSADYTPLITTAGTTYYYCIVTNSSTCSVTSAVSGAIIVNAVPVISSQSTATATYCTTGTATALSVTATGTGLSYQWYSNTSASNTGGTIISGATSADYTPLITTAGTTYYYCIVTNSSTCSVTSAVSGAIIVNAVPVISSQSTATATYCTTGTATALSVTATGTGLSYQWYSNTSASNTGGTIISGATSADYTPLITTAGTTYYYCIVTNNSSCSVTSAVSGAIIVSSLPVINSQSTLAANYCQYGTASSISVTATGTGLTYQWYSNASNSNSGGQSISFATSSSYTPLVTTLGSTYYYCVVTNSNNCSVTSSVSGAISVTRCPFNWTGTTNTDMGTSSNWSTFYTPTSSDTVIISSGVSNMPVLSGVLNVANLTINSGATLTLASGSNLNVYSNITNNGTITATSTSTLAMAGTSSQTISGSSSYSIYNLAINNAAGVSITSSLTANGTITIPNGVLTTNGNLTINFDNGGNIAYSATDAGSISGNVTGTRNFTLGSHYISSPFIGTTVNQIAATTPLTHNGTSLLYTKNFANQNWTAVSSNSTSMSSGEGFSLTLFNAEPVNLTGTYTHNATVSGSSYSNATATEYFLVGNPYPSTLDWNSASGWTNTNISSAIYQWNPTTDVVSSYVSGAGVNGGSNLIPAMQAFMVVTTGSGGNSSVNFGPLCRVTSNTSFFRTVNDPSLTLEVENANSQIDQTLIRFSDMASENYDPTVDAVKCMNPSIVPSLYTVSDDNKNLAINTSPMITPGDAIPLNLKVVVGGTYTIQCSQYNVPGYQLVLFDKFNQSQTIIDTTLKYTIQSLSTDSTDRFQLRLASISTITGTQPLVSTSNALHIYSTESGFIVNTNANNSGSSEIMILDAMGRTLKIMNNITLQTGNNFFPLADIASGVYLVRVTNNTGNYVQKISLVK